MFKNYFKTATRTLLKNKVFTLINIIGLAIGISAAIVIYLVVMYDFGFDKAHPNGDRIYRVVSNFDFKGQLGYSSGAPAPLGKSIRRELPGITQTVPFSIYGSDVNVNIPKTGSVSTSFTKQNQLIVTDGSYFKLFKYQWLAGTAQLAFKNPNQVVLTASRAKLYFPGVSYADVLGRQVIYNDTVKMAVSGVVQDLEQNTDFTFHDFISVPNGDYHNNLGVDDWNNTSGSDQLFIQLSNNASKETLLKQISNVYYRHTADKKYSRSQSFYLQPLTDIHFNSLYGAFNQRLANKNVLYGLLGVATFLLLLGCINFINLNTAQSTQRAKEIGIRKTIGGTRKQLIGQFLTETFMLTLAATLLSAVLVYFLIKLFAGFIPEGVTYQTMFTPAVGIFIVVLMVSITLLSGLYPAMIMSGYQPVQIIKNQRGAINGKGNNHYLRKGLTVAQFVIAQVFVMGTLLVSSQLHYILNKDLGFKKDAVLYINTPYSQMNTDSRQVFANKLAAIPQIAQISMGSSPPASEGAMSTHMSYKEGKKNFDGVVFLKYGDENFFNVYGLKMLAGRSPLLRDSTSGIVINETYAKELGFTNPADAVGKTIANNGNNEAVQIIGVVHDFNQNSLHMPIVPIAITCSGLPNYNTTIHIALKPQTEGTRSWATALSQMEKAWKAVYPNQEFKYQFVDDSIAKFYTTEQNTAKLLNWATGLSVLISCLGLLGLAIYTTNQRTKEIGVRKVMGATVSQIVSMLSLDFVKLIIMAFVIAAPIAWYAMNQWLQNFAYHAQISVWLFAGTVASTIMVALLSMSLQTVKAAIANPVNSLRSE